MTDKVIKYRSGYKHQLASDYNIYTPLKPIIEIKTDYITLDIEGNLVVKAGYAWDGASGPVPDTNKVLRASLVHDALYQLMRMMPDNFSDDQYRDKADLLFKDICIEDGVIKSKAKVYYFGLKSFGGPAADPTNVKKVKKAPR